MSGTDPGYSAADRHHAPISDVGYKLRKPEDSVIHRIIAENLSSFVDQANQASGGQHFPAFLALTMTCIAK
jgi:hypothetical protein